MMSKYDIHKNKELPGDDEINKYKNFDKVMKKAALYDYKQATKPVYKNVKVLSIVAVIVALGLIFLFESVEQEEETEKLIKQSDSIQIKKSTPVKDTIRAQSKAKPAAAPAEVYHPSAVQTPDNVSLAAEQTQTAATSTVSPTAPINTSAHFVGGEDALKNYLEKHIKYPYNAIESPYSGKVEVDLVIEKTGKVGTFTIYDSPNTAISNEITRVIKSMPDWKPAIKNGVQVPTTVTVAFPFKYISE